MNSGGSNNLSLKYQRFTLSGCRDKAIRKFKFVAKTQSIYKLGLTVLIFCLFVSNKRQNGLRDRVQIFFGKSYESKECLWMFEFLKIHIFYF